MAQLILKDLYSRIKIKLGNINTRQLDPAILIENLYSAINKRLVQLRLSTQNHQLKSFTIPLTNQREYIIPASDFGREVIVEATTPTNTILPVEMQNYANLTSTDESFAVAFYKDATGKHILALNSVSNRPGYSLKVWYEPDTPIGRQLSVALPINSMFADVVVIDCSIMCLPHVKYTAMLTDSDFKEEMSRKRDIASVLVSEKSEWDDLFNKDINTSKTQTRVIRRGFHAGY